MIASTSVEITGDGMTARIYVSALDQNGAAVTGALVDVQGMYLLETAGVYGGDVTWATAWDVNLAWHGNIVRRHVTAPAAFTVTVTPDPPRRQMPATLTWTAQPATTMCVTVGGGAASCDVDMGHLDLPATQFSTAGHYDIVVSRTLQGSDGRATLRVLLPRDVT